MTRRILVAVILLLFSSIPASAAAPDQGLQLIDYTDEFDTVWQQVATVPKDRRVEAFQAAFATILPGFYDPERVKDFIPKERYQELIAKGLQAYPEKKAGIQRVSREFSALIAPAQQSFERAFGPMHGYPSVYLVNSFGEFDGGTRKLKDGVHLMFGADMIDQLYKTTPIQPFFHHELFHLYHGRSFDECEAVYCSLWKEGLAVHVASTLNPGASDASLLLTFPVSLREAVEKDRSGAICSVVAKLDSTRNEDFPPLFQGRPQPGAKFPPRYGYYVGYLVAQDLGRTRDLKQLAALTPAEVEPLVKQSLASMATCPDKATGERG